MRAQPGVLAGVEVISTPKVTATFAATIDSRDLTSSTDVAFLYGGETLLE